MRLFRIPAVYLNKGGIYIDQRKIIIENYKEIIDICDDKVVLKEITIIGKMIIKEINKDKIIMEGKIFEVKFLENKER